MNKIKFDFNNMMAHNIGPVKGITEKQIRDISDTTKNACQHINNILKDRPSRMKIGLEWAMLPWQEKTTLNKIKKIAGEIAASYDNVISLGIGGSYLGLKACQDALCGSYYNEFASVRKGRPRIYFDGNNMDPDTLIPLLKNLNPKKTFVIVISKSGETTETKAAFAIVERWLRKSMGSKFGRQILAITDPVSGALRKKITAVQSSDKKAFRNLEVMKGVGGRFSELNIGLLHMAIVGINIDEVLNGAATMSKKCLKLSIMKNPAAMYAAFHTILFQQKKRDISILMPFSERLKSTSDWYVQLLAESLGKKYARKVHKGADGMEIWQNDKKRVINTGRTPIPSRGTNDLHSIQQNNIEGRDNKVITFIKVNSFKEDLTVKGTGDFLAGKKYSYLLATAEEATEWALAAESRPSCTITIPCISGYSWGGLLYFFEMATAIEGELLGVNAFDQPGVEGYKNYMYCKLGKKGVPQNVIDSINKFKMTKLSKYIII